VCCSVLQCVAVCCSVLQCVAVCCSVLQCVAVSVYILEMHARQQGCVAVCCSVLQCVAVCCSVLQCGVSQVIHKMYTYTYIYMPSATNSVIRERKVNCVYRGRNKSTCKYTCIYKYFHVYKRRNKVYTHSWRCTHFNI